MKFEVELIPDGIYLVRLVENGKSNLLKIDLRKVVDNLQPIL